MWDRIRTCNALAHCEQRIIRYVKKVEDAIKRSCDSVELFPLQNDTEFPEGSENTLKNWLHVLFFILQFTKWKRFLMACYPLKMDLEHVWKLKSAFLEKLANFNKIWNNLWHSYNLMCVNQPWATKNEAKMSPLQKWTCLSVFELLLRFLNIPNTFKKICGYGFFIHCMNVLKKWFLYLSTPTNEHFVSKFLTKLDLELQKIWKKEFFSIF